MSGAIIAAISCGSIVVVVLLGAMIYFLCFNNSKESYKPNDKGGADSGIFRIFNFSELLFLSHAAWAMP